MTIDASNKLRFLISFRNDISLEHLNPILMTKIITFTKLRVQKLPITDIRLTISIFYLGYLINWRILCIDLNDFVDGIGSNNRVVEFGEIVDRLTPGYYFYEV